MNDPVQLVTPPPDAVSEIATLDTPDGSNDTMLFQPCVKSSQSARVVWTAPLRSMPAIDTLPLSYLSAIMWSMQNWRDAVTLLAATVAVAYTVGYS